MKTIRRWWGLALSCLTLGCGESPTSTAPSADQAASAIASVSAASSASAPSATPSSDEPKEVALARQIVTWLGEGQHAKVRALFDGAMDKAIPTDAALTQMWSSIETQFGRFKAQLAAESTKHPPHTIVLVTCTFEKSPMDVRVVFDAAGKLAGLQIVPSQSPAAVGERPQTPKPPFPYEAREVSYVNPKGGGTIGGTLTLPEGAGPHPAVLLITGSGPQDRDETLYGHKPFLVIADHLTRKGIAVLRVDDRGVGKTTGDPATSTVEDHAGDAAAGVAFLTKQKEIDAKRIGLVGHSEGGVIAPMVAATSSEVAFVVSLAGPGVSGAELNPMQVEALLVAQKVPAPVIAEVVAGQKKLMKQLVADAPEAELIATIKELATAGAKATPGVNPDDLEVKKAVAMELTRLLSPWFRSWAKLDPATHLAKVKVPVLLLIGDKDLQVPADVNLAKAKAALAHNGNVRAEKLPGLNHLFQTAKTGGMDEYAAIPETFSPAALTLMSDWLLDTTNRNGQSPRSGRSP